MKKKIVYVPFASDILHSGHIKIINSAKKIGRVFIGLLTDQAISEYKKIPFFNFQTRKLIFENLKFVEKVIPQDTLDFRKNLNMLKPNYVIHGDDWKKGILKNTRKNVIKYLKKWNGKLIELKYSKNISSTFIQKKILKNGVDPVVRLKQLRRMLDAKKIVRILESHSALSSSIIENLEIKKNNRLFRFDGMWSSSLTDSTLRAKPDNQSVDYSTRIIALNETLDTTTKPIIFDADNGGRIEHLHFLIKSLERSGVSAVVIEDKIGLKRNSLFKNQKGIKQDSISNFSKKIKLIKNIRISEDFLIAARIESLILGKKVSDALKRAEAYSKAGADLIMIHSKEKTPNEIFEFSNRFKKSKFFKPLIAIPSTYSKTYEKELVKNGVQIVIYANQMLRASYQSMLSTAKTILEKQRAHEVDKSITSIKEILELIK